jgi:acyl carrier protein
MDARALIAEITRSDMAAYGDDTALADVENWDSMRAVRFVLRLEEIVGRPLTEADIDGLKSIGDVDRILRNGA